MSHNHQQNRRNQALDKRVQAAEIAFERKHEKHFNNQEEHTYHDTLLMSFTKGLEHDPITGLVKNHQDFYAIVKSIEYPTYETFAAIPRPPRAKLKAWRSEKANNVEAEYRAWESAGAGMLFDLQGPDAQAYTMPPAPSLESPELTQEMRDVYLQAILRDFPLAFFDTTGDTSLLTECQLNWWNRIKNHYPELDKNAIFRGCFAGDSEGPYLSQFMLVGNKVFQDEHVPREGYIQYGSQKISQKVRTATPKIDHMQTWDEWMDVQEGASLIRNESYLPKDAPDARRFITSGRDLATYVHYDALYQAYLNACLILWSYNTPLDEGIPFKMADINDGQQGFAHFGGPHILSLVTEVATRALKAVRYQKFNNHRRLRPEALAARIQMASTFPENHHAQPAMESLKSSLAGILSLINDFNGERVGSNAFQDSYQNVTGELTDIEHNYLLPMAFCEGSPMHPSYGAGHATVAGACTTILKAFFDMDLYLQVSENGDSFTLTKHPESASFPFVPSVDGGELINVENSQPLTLEGELHKLAANISVGRNWAGVHYFSDYKYSMLLGEKIALGVLQEQSIMYNESESEYEGGPFMSLNLFSKDVHGHSQKVYIQNGHILTKKPRKRKLHHSYKKNSNSVYA